MAKTLEFEDSARRALERGVDALANAVKVTLGPRGRNVVIDKKWGAPTITNDGVTIAKEGLRNVAAGAAPSSLKRGIDAAVEAVSERLLEVAREVEGKDEIANVATISAQDATIGELIAEAFD